jgi:hypothetical protein
MKISCLEAELFNADGRTDRRNKTNSQFCESAYKYKSDDCITLPARQSENMEQEGDCISDMS